MASAFAAQAAETSRRHQEFAGRIGRRRNPPLQRHRRENPIICMALSRISLKHRAVIEEMADYAIANPPYSYSLTPPTCPRCRRK
jgi:hypothetical protein